MCARDLKLGINATIARTAFALCVCKARKPLSYSCSFKETLCLTMRLRLAVFSSTVAQRSPYPPVPPTCLDLEKGLVLLPSADALEGRLGVYAPQRAESGHLSLLDLLA